jgi:hypothetical protein
MRNPKAVHLDAALDGMNAKGNIVNLPYFQAAGRQVRTPRAFVGIQSLQLAHRPVRTPELDGP